MLEYKNNIKEVRIKDGVTSISQYAFYYCTNLTSITIPDDLTSISQYAFSACGAIRYATIGSESAKELGKKGYSFRDPRYPQLVLKYNYENGIGSLSVVSADKDAESIAIPEGVVNIDNSAFYNHTNLVSITIPNSVINIGNEAFRGCNCLSGITIPDCVTSIGDATFYDCSSLTNVYLPESVTSIGHSAFDGCSSLTDIAIPEGVTIIGTAFFYRCIALTNVIIPESVISIGAWAFRNCNSLSAITIPEGVKNISDQAFKDCAAIRYAPVGSEGAKALGKAQYFFRDNCYPKIDMQYVYSNGEISDFQIVDADLDIQEVVSPVDVTSIGSEAFSFCYYLRSITLPNGLTSIGGSAFYGCWNLESITIPDSVNNVNWAAFYSCPAIRYATIESVAAKALGEAGYSFRDIRFPKIDLKYYYSNEEISSFSVDDADEDIENAFIPEGVICICNGAFGNCDRLTDITLPASLQTIGAEAFLNCSSLSRVHYNDTEDAAFRLAIDTGNALLLKTEWEYKDVSPLHNLTSILWLPSAVNTIESEAFAGTAAQAIIIPNGTTTIESGAFTQSSSLLYVQVPESVYQIAENAFIGNPYVTIICSEEGLIHTWANEHGIPTIAQ